MTYSTKPLHLETPTENNSMAYSIPSIENDLERIKAPHQPSFSSNSSINHVLVTVTQEIAELLQYGRLVQSKGGGHAETVAIRAIEPEYRQAVVN